MIQHPLSGVVEAVLLAAGRPVSVARARASSNVVATLRAASRILRSPLGGCISGIVAAVTRLRMTMTTSNSTSVSPRFSSPRRKQGGVVVVEK